MFNNHRSLLFKPKSDSLIITRCIFTFIHLSSINQVLNHLFLHVELEIFCVVQSESQSKKQNLLRCSSNLKRQRRYGYSIQNQQKEQKLFIFYLQQRKYNRNNHLEIEALYRPFSTFIFRFHYLLFLLKNKSHLFFHHLVATVAASCFFKFNFILIQSKSIYL